MILMYVNLIKTSDLCTFESKFNFDVARLPADPQIDLITIVKYHDIIICQVILFTNQRRGDKVITKAKHRQKKQIFDTEQTPHVKVHRSTF